MCISTAFIFILGIAQIVGDVYLELYSLGIGTHIAAGLISEGLSDIFYAISAAKSGYFSWSDYAVHKIKSILITIATTGFAALLSKGIRFSRFGSMLVGDTGKLSQLSGSRLLEVSGKTSLTGVKNNVIKKVWWRIGMKLAEGSSFALANAGISYISERAFKDYCDKIVNELFLNIRQSVQNKKEKIRESLTTIYQTYVSELTQKWLSEIN
ncbi:unnamed protein product [Rotaria sordida]|uniref:Uncharacterized protein n=1 Tax=Rotaria sordida TaxID=392033 RepID=A0A814B544_9BILA|nr:unnamed protein product [Rotaria sordida]